MLALKIEDFRKCWFYWVICQSSVLSSDLHHIRRPQNGFMTSTTGFQHKWIWFFSFHSVITRLLRRWDTQNVFNKPKCTSSLVILNVALPRVSNPTPVQLLAELWVSQAPQCPGSGHPPSAALPQAWLPACLLFLAAKQPGEDQDDQAVEIRTTWSSPHYLTR